MKASTLTNQLHLLKPDQLMQLASDMVTAGIAKELGGDWRGVFRTQMYSHGVGYLHRVYKLLASMDYQGIEALTNSITRR